MKKSTSVIIVCAIAGLFGYWNSQRQMERRRQFQEAERIEEERAWGLSMERRIEGMWEDERERWKKLAQNLKQDLPSTPGIKQTNWTTISIPGICTFQIPPTLEKRRAGTLSSGLADSFRRILPQLAESPAPLVIQPRGTDDINTRVTEYSRILVETSQGKPKDFPKLGERLSLGHPAVSEIKDGADRFFASGAGEQGINVISSETAKVVKLTGTYAVLLNYRRTGTQGRPVQVYSYFIFNNDLLHSITISYRESEREIWAADLADVTDSFQFIARP